MLHALKRWLDEAPGLAWRAWSALRDWTGFLPKSQLIAALCKHDNT